jgi:F-type H+-transporting ATPase subunit b
VILADQLPLGINIGNLIAQVVTFIILLIVLGKYVFPLLFKTMDQRAATIREGVENAEKSRRELAEAQQRVEALLEQARRDAQAAIGRATAAAEQVRVGIEQDAQKRAQDILTQAERRIQQEVAQARVQLRQEVADLAIQAAEHVVGKSMDQATSRRLVSEFVAQSDARARDLQC